MQKLYTFDDFHVYIYEKIGITQTSKELCDYIRRIYIGFEYITIRYEETANLFQSVFELRFFDRHLEMKLRVVADTMEKNFNLHPDSVMRDIVPSCELGVSEMVKLIKSLTINDREYSDALIKKIFAVIGVDYMIENKIPLPKDHETISDEFSKVVGYGGADQYYIGLTATNNTLCLKAASNLRVLFELKHEIFINDNFYPQIKPRSLDNKMLFT